MLEKPDAFLSYTRFDDRKGKITQFCQELSDAVEEVSGYPFKIFQDIEGIGLGEKWQDVLDEMLDQARFFIPILTPKFFNSGPCRDELSKFLSLERKADRQDLVLPIYWITCPVLEEGHLKAVDELAQAIGQRHRSIWTGLSQEEVVAKSYQIGLRDLAIQITKIKGNSGSKIKPYEVQIPEKREPLEIFRDWSEPWCPEMVVIPAGSFFMGSPDDEEDRRDNEGPRHEVTISQPFGLGRYPITFESYDFFCEETSRSRPHDREWGRIRRPVIGISHEDAEAYCTWLSIRTGAKYRLPTEAEWEYACRAGTITRYSFGDNICEKHANFGPRASKTSKVDDFPANPWGLYDMHGNVWEWCADGPREYEDTSVIDPKGPIGHAQRVLRGGARCLSPPVLRSAARCVHRPRARGNLIGFRCARELNSIAADF